MIDIISHAANLSTGRHRSAIVFLPSGHPGNQAVQGKWLT